MKKRKEQRLVGLRKDYREMTNPIYESLFPDNLLNHDNRGSNLVSPKPL